MMGVVPDQGKDATDKMCVPPVEEVGDRPLLLVGGTESLDQVLPVSVIDQAAVPNRVAINILVFATRRICAFESCSSIGGS